MVIVSHRLSSLVDCDQTLIGKGQGRQHRPTRGAAPGVRRLPASLAAAEPAHGGWTTAFAQTHQGARAIIMAGTVVAIHDLIPNRSRAVATVPMPAALLVPK